MVAANTCGSHVDIHPPPHRNADAAAGRVVLMSASFYSRASVHTN